MNQLALTLNSKKLLLPSMIGILLVFLYSQSLSQNVQLRVVVAKQSDSPLLLVSTFVDTSNRLQPRYGLSLTNSAKKRIVAYAVQETIDFGNGPEITTTNFAHFPAEKLLLAPSNSKHVEVNAGRTYDKPPTQINLAVDFVEFDDGERWGNDVSSSGDMLDGKRAGGTLALKKYRELLSREGDKRLEEALETSGFIQPERAPKSGAWADGFKQGVNIVKYRIKQAKAQGRQAVQRELNSPFDSADGRLEP